MQWKDIFYLNYISLLDFRTNGHGRSRVKIKRKKKRRLNRLCLSAKTVQGGPAYFKWKAQKILNSSRNWFMRSSKTEQTEQTEQRNDCSVYWVVKQRNFRKTKFKVLLTWTKIIFSLYYFHLKSWLIHN